MSCGGGGVRVLVRDCNAPAPANDGKECEGEDWMVDTTCGDCPCETCNLMINSLCAVFCLFWMIFSYAWHLNSAWIIIDANRFEMHDSMLCTHQSLQLFNCLINCYITKFNRLCYHFSLYQANESCSRIVSRRVMLLRSLNKSYFRVTAPCYRGWTAILWLLSHCSAHNTKTS